MTTNEETTMTTDEAKLCECCEKRPAEHASEFRTQRDVGKVHYCDVCDNAVPLVALCERIRANRRRSRPAAELEALEFVAPRDRRLDWVCPWLNDMPQHRHFRAGDRVKLYRVSPQIPHAEWALCQNGLCGLLVGNDSIARIHSELVALRDGTGVRDTPAPQGDGAGVSVLDADGNALRVGDTVQRINGMNQHVRATVVRFVGGMVETTYGPSPYTSCGLRKVAPSEDPKRQPEANPLRHLAEAFRELCECFCADCETICPPGRMVPMDERCVYCYQNTLVQTGDGEMERICEWREGFGIEQAVPPPAPERHASDWYVDPDAPAGLA